MPEFIVDEDMPRSLAPLWRASGFTSVDVRDVGLRGQSDEQVFRYAQQHGLVIITADMGFANLLTFPLRTHAGIVVVCLPNQLPTALVNAEVVGALTELAGENLNGSLTIIEGERIRLRLPLARS